MNTRVYNWDVALWEFLAAATWQPDITPQIGEIQQPVLVVSGDDDGLVPVTDSARLDTELPNSRLAVLPNCGHVPQEECPEEFIEAVAAWLAGRLE
jgi:pimeloyl-ACP methyl ester carboxylesterase